MAFGGRWLYREIVRLGFDPRRRRRHRPRLGLPRPPQYFGYLTWTFLTDPDRYRRLYQPIPMFHNNLWDDAAAVRLVAVGATHVQMWRSLTPEKLVSFSSYAVSLRTVHEVDYWATDAIPEDSRFYWKSFFRYSGEFRAVPLFIPMYGDAVRAKSYPRSLVQQYTQIRRWAWGVTDIPYYIQNAFAHREIPRRLRVRRLIDLWLDHINWAIAPFVIIFGVEPAAAAQPGLRPDDARPEPAAVCRLAADRRLLLPAHPRLRRGADRAAATGAAGRSPSGCVSYLQWLALPVVGPHLQQPAGARRADAADGRQVPRVPGDREGLTRGDAVATGARAGGVGGSGPRRCGQRRRLRAGRDDDVDEDRRVGHELAFTLNTFSSSAIVAGQLGLAAVVDPDPRLRHVARRAASSARWRSGRGIRGRPAIDVAWPTWPEPLTTQTTPSSLAICSRWASSFGSILNAFATVWRIRLTFGSIR